MVAIVLSIVVFIASSILFVVLGFTCGYRFSQKLTKQKSSKIGKQTSGITDLELKENVAYSTLHSSSCVHHQQAPRASII